VELHPQLVIIGRIALAALLGYLVGLDRAARGKDAGDRTFALVALGSAAFVAMGEQAFPFTADRIVQGVATGVGFLGAGVIFRASGSVKGLTTAAALWGAAAIGAVVGVGFYLTGVALAGLVLIVLELHAVGFMRRLGRADDDEDRDTDSDGPPRG
jgi:putative Mg2+ transporter-C (MgtC) family protein